MDEELRQLDQGHAAAAVLRLVLRLLREVHPGVRRRRTSDLRDHGAERAALRARGLSRNAARASRASAGDRPPPRSASRTRGHQDCHLGLGPQLGPAAVAAGCAGRSGRAKVRARHRVALLRRRCLGAEQSPRRISGQGRVVHRVFRRGMGDQLRRQPEVQRRHARDRQARATGRAASHSGILRSTRSSVRTREAAAIAAASSRSTRRLAPTRGTSSTTRSVTPASSCCPALIGSNRRAPTRRSRTSRSGIRTGTPRCCSCSTQPRSRAPSSCVQAEDRCGTHFQQRPSLH